MRRVAFTLLGVLVAASVKAGEACTQGKGVYADASGLYTLTFEPVDPETSAATHRFKVAVKDTPILLDGYVMTTEPVARPQGMLFHNCPEGDATGADIAACTVWQDIVYGASGGTIVTLPDQDKPAVGELLLPGFAPSLQSSSAWGKGKAEREPSDTLTLTGCAP